MSLKIEVMGLREDTCSLSGKQCECIVVTIEGHAITARPLSIKSFLSLIKMHVGHAKPIVPVESE